MLVASDKASEDAASCDVYHLPKFPSLASSEATTALLHASRHVAPSNLLLHASTHSVTRKVGSRMLCNIVHARDLI